MFLGCPEDALQLSLFPPQAQSLLRGAIGEAEEYGVFGCLVRHRIPGRRDEDIVGSPFERAISDAAGSVPLDDAIDRGIGGTIRRAYESGGQRLQERAESPGDRGTCGVQILDFCSVTRMKQFVLS